MTQPVALVHGVGLDRHMWDEVAERLGAATRCPELIGHGRRPGRDHALTLAELGDDVVEQLPDEPVHLVGFSLGALVAAWVAVHRADRLTRLTLVSSVFDRSPAERTAVEERLAAARRADGSSVEASIGRWFPPGSAVSDRTRAAVRHRLESNDHADFLRAYAVFATADAELADQVEAIAVPTLVCTGELDPGSTPAMTYALADHIPGARAVVVPGTRHLLPLEAPDDLARLIIGHRERGEMS